MEEAQSADNLALGCNSPGTQSMGLENSMSKFRCYANAKSFSERTIKASAIILGDDGLYWVVTLAEMERLLRAGYELAD